MEATYKTKFLKTRRTSSKVSAQACSTHGPVAAGNWFKAGVEDCLKEAPVDGQCHEYAEEASRGTMPNWTRARFVTWKIYSKIAKTLTQTLRNGIRANGYDE